MFCLLLCCDLNDCGMGGLNLTGYLFFFGWLWVWGDYLFCWCCLECWFDLFIWIGIGLIVV